MSAIIQASTIIPLQNNAIVRWKSEGLTFREQDFLKLLEENHAFNFQLWQEEDKARREDMGFEFVYQAKRKIDGFNQQRNNRMEMMDEWLFLQLKPSEDGNCPVHSETPGMMIDRLSILALKAYHMHIQATRGEADEAHRALCAKKLTTILAQQKQLGLCFDELIAETQAQSRRFKVYHQFKMYNDPRLNPELYQ